MRTNRVVAGHPSVHRLSAVSTQPSNTCASRAGSVTAENGNAYTVTISDDGTFMAEYVQPPALSIPLGISGSTVEVRRNEDLTFSAMINGEWVMITADTTVTAANGNVYAAVLSPDGIPIGVMHVAAMQEVMLGALGGTVTVKQAEDMTWWIGEMEVKDGTVYTAANGNMYALMMDSEGMWSAMYQKVMVTVALGTQGSVELVRAEDMSWWLGSEGVGVGSEVMSDNGNTYTLWYTDGIWSARFEPESMMIEGTGLVAMTREADDMYDVDGTTLPASGMGDIDTSQGTYRVTMMDGVLMGTRLDNVAIDGDTDFKTVGLGALPTIPGDEDDTEDVNEAKTALKVGGDLYSFNNLLPDGMSEQMGANFVAAAKEELEGIKANIQALLAVFETEADRDLHVSRQWGTAGTGNASKNVKGVLDAVFGDAGITVSPDDDDAVSRIEDLIAALSTEDLLGTALADDGVLENATTNGKSAADIFNATKWEASVSYGMLGNTRYGAIMKKERDNATSDAQHVFDNDATTDGQQGSKGELGAFGFGTTAETARARYVQTTTGTARYMGKTLAISGAGTHFSGDIDIQVRFTTSKVSGLITGLTSAGGDPWEYQYGDVEAIVLPTMTMTNAGVWGGDMSDPTVVSEGASVTFARRAGSPIPQSVDATFSGRLLGGSGNQAGSEAVGTWSVGENPDSNDYLAAGYGAMRTEDDSVGRPTPDDEVTTIEAKLLSAAPADLNDGNTNNYVKTELSSGMLKITVAKYGWEAGGDVNTGATLNDPTWTWGRLDDGSEDNTTTDDATRTYDIALTALKAKEFAEHNTNGAIYRALAKARIEQLRESLATLISADLVPDEQRDLWHEVQQTLLEYVFQPDRAHVDPGTDGTDFTERLPHSVRGGYDKDTALSKIDNILLALSSASNLEEALDPDEDGFFVREDNNQPFVTRGSGDIFGEKDSQVKTWFGTTDYTRFGAWRVRRSRDAQRSGGWDNAEMDTFAYSPLSASKITSRNSPNYPAGATANYQGRTVAFVGNVGYEGEVDVRVEWNALQDSGGTDLAIGAQVQTVISNLQNANGDLYVNADEDVRELVFPAVAMVVAADDDLVDFAETSGSVSVNYVDRSVTPGTLSITNHQGAFVGSSAEGPLGLLGRYSMGNINGAYGADLP
ncbi:MAG: hypothetical protein F4X12_21415 [Acidobacteriia bacterium]|nr:hypothetical protein [Terriglobia bacterium]